MAEVSAVEYTIAQLQLQSQTRDPCVARHTRLFLRLPVTARLSAVTGTTDPTFAGRGGSAVRQRLSSAASATGLSGTLFP